MSIYIVQHGKSLSKEVDPKRRLSEEGKSEVKRISEVAKGYHINVSEIKHSGKQRARETAEIFGEALNPTNGVGEISGINPMDDIAPFAEQVNSQHNIMYVGHLPFMERLVSFLITGDMNIKWGLMPNIS